MDKDNITEHLNNNKERFEFCKLVLKDYGSYKGSIG